jgi:hypothetical protein
VAVLAWISLVVIIMVVLLLLLLLFGDLSLFDDFGAGFLHDGCHLKIREIVRDGSFFFFFLLVCTQCFFQVGVGGGDLG